MIQSTSLDAYQDLKQHLGTRHSQVLNTLSSYPSGLTSRSIARALQLELHCVSGRIRELVGRDLIRDSGRKSFDQVTGKAGIVWIRWCPVLNQPEFTW